ncbi:hypothetical protein ACEWPN_20925 [Yoonia sp. R2-816]
MSHSSFLQNGVRYDLAHLTAFAAGMPNRGEKPDQTLGIVVAFSNHVYTNRTKYGDQHDFVDHHGTKRTFDHDRFKMSLKLPDLIKAAIASDTLTFISHSFGGNKNLMLIETDEGRQWSVVFCFESIPGGVRMEVLSTHPRVVNESQKNRRHLSYFARMCLFNQIRVP